MRDMSEIEGLLADYFDVLHRCDLVLFDRVFAESCALQTIRDGKLVHTPLADYRAYIASRVSPQKAGTPRDERVLMLDQLDEACAMAKVFAKVGEAAYMDYLSLMKTDGRWVIVSKVYQPV